MDRSRLNEWLAIATNIAVLAGIIILAIEIRQNSTAIRSSVLQSVSNESTPLYLALATNSELRETWILGSADPSALTESQGLQSNTTMHVWFSNAQNWYSQALSGVLDEDIADGHWTTMATMHSTSPGFRQYWESRSYLYTPAFRRFVETEVFTRESIQSAANSSDRDSEAGAEMRAIKDQLDVLYRASLAEGTIETKLRNHLGFFAPEPTVQPPGQLPIVGQDAVSEFYREIFESGIQVLENEYTALTIVVHGTTATRQYVGEGTFMAAGSAAPQSSKNRYVDLLVKVDGVWKTLVHSWEPEAAE